MTSYFITGTDTDIGKTIAAAWLQLHVQGVYFKPIQSGHPKDIDTIKALTQLPDTHFMESRYELSQPLSPHEAAKRDGVSIALDDFTIPNCDKPLIIEGAGGLMVPINENDFIIDLIPKFALPTILVCRSSLGTINHTLLSLEALRTRQIDIAGIVMIGDKSSHNRHALEEYGNAPIIAEIPFLDPLNKATLLAIKPEIDLT